MTRLILQHSAVAPRQPASKLDNIQILRALAATLVVVDHAIISQGNASTDITQLAWQMGNVGVWTFFVISGFIIYYSEGKNFGTFSCSLRFAWKRLARIVPLYWIATAVAIGLNLLAAANGHLTPPHAIVSLHNVFFSLFFLPYVSDSGDRPLPILGPGWTLEYEMIFYLLFGFSMLLPSRLGKKTFLYVLLCTVVVGAFIRPLGDKSDARTIYAFLSNPVLLLFVVGTALAALRQKLEFVASSYYLFLLAPLLLIPCVALHYGSFRYPLSSLEKMVFWIPCVCTVIVCLYAKAPRGLKQRFFVLLGDASYATYLSNFFVVSLLSKAFLRFGWHFAVWLYVGLSIVLASICGVALHFFLERPLLKALGRPAILFGHGVRGT